ncbi:MAG: hypothetical protein IKK21_05205 [Clostridia bacterium]|nr:hypothetical protein [Clostridia bacterium]
MKKQLTAEEKRLDTDLWLILLVTLGAFFAYAALQGQIMAIANNGSIPVMLRLLLIAAAQFGVAGLGITIVCVMRKEKFTQFGLVKKNTGKAIAGTIACFVPSVCCTILSGRFNGYRPFGSVMLTDEVMASGVLTAIPGMALIVIMWGFFEGFNYAVISEKINSRYPSKNQWLDYGAITCAAICLLFHPINTSFWGIVDMVTMFLAVYGMLIVKKKTGNAWGCVFAFCLIWNAI